MSTEMKRGPNSIKMLNENLLEIQKLRDINTINYEGILNSPAYKVVETKSHKGLE